MDMPMNTTSVLNAYVYKNALLNNLNAFILIKWLGWFVSAGMQHQGLSGLLS
jgi:hypothetical protein